jgi:hypothetical protein
LPSSDEASVFIDELPTGVSSMSVKWEETIDQSVVFLMLLGAFLLLGCRMLQSSQLVHAVIGATVSAALIIFAATWWLYNNARNTLGVPFAGFLTFLMTSALALLPIDLSIFSSVGPSSSTIRNTIWTLLNWRDPFYGLPIGWMLAALFSGIFFFTILSGARWSMAYFASPPDPEGEVLFEIGRDGRRIDILPPTPFPQQLLGWMIWLAGLLILLQSTYSDIASLTFTMIVLCWQNLSHCIFSWLGGFCGLCRRDLAPSDLRPLVSLDTYARQTRIDTHVAIANLQKHIQRHRDVFHRLGEKSELRIRRFSDTGIHAHPPDVFDNSHTSSCPCTLL